MDQKKASTTKKAPATFKEFMSSSLIIGYDCSRSGSKKAPHMINTQDVLLLCKKLKTPTPKYGHVHPTQYPDKARD